MVRQHHQFNEHEFEQTPGDTEGWESLAAVHEVTKSRSQISNLTTQSNELAYKTNDSNKYYAMCMGQ